MCGIAAFVPNATATHLDALAIVTSMTERMSRRGPDGSGHWTGDGAALGHRRLAIIDLDDRAKQPMFSSDGRFAIVFNGEIYNFAELRQDLLARGLELRTTSDTEVLLELYSLERERMLPRLRGMFALAIWDMAERELFVARDPYGIKPLYLAECTQGVVVASQVKAILETGLVSREPDPAGQAGFWMLGSVPEPRTWFRDIRCLGAGCWARVTSSGCTMPKVWWDIGEAWRNAGTASEPSAVQEIARGALQRAVAAHLVADVPVGIFLSGGIDSGSLAALMLEAGAQRLRGLTLTYGEFSGKADDEAPVAARIARQYGIEHYVRTVTSSEFALDLPAILDAMDQPSVDGINTWYASKAAREHGLKAVVSGVGGDELFQGYSSFAQLPRLIGLRRAVALMPGGLAMARWACQLQARRSGNPRWTMVPAALSSIEGAWFIRRGLFSPDEAEAIIGAPAAEHGSIGALVRQSTGSLPANARLALAQIESMTYLRNQLLRDSDWASMDHSVELRTPLVDAWLLRDLEPALGSFEKFRQKRLLAAAPLAPLAEDIIGRRKTGFGIPVQRWLVDMGRARGGDGMSRAWARELTQGIYA